MFGSNEPEPQTEEALSVEPENWKRESGLRRKALVDELYRGYGQTRPGGRSVRSLRSGIKRFSWVVIVSGTIFLKRLMDILVSAIALIALSPLFLVVAVAIWAEDGGTPLFWQQRVGQWGRVLRFPKFRSMVLDAEKRKKDLLAVNQHGEGITFKMKRDPRITRIGAIIRKLSIDELPQLWCVLKGDMSLVGPRPPVPAEVARYTLADRRRLDVKPGLTCIWQVSGRSELSFDKQVSLDVQYIDSHSILLDIALLLKTIPAILSGRGAY
jgi:lipopolysaccharide/colanic/teichoic acid biosynthesis glycosyltransferase